jgi:alkylation response protein AidB-like acyl-CoA dehydrogenase
VTIAVQTTDPTQIPAPKPTRFRHLRLRDDGLRDLAPLGDAVSVASAVRELYERGFLDIPLLGSKDTRTRFRCLVELGAHDLSLARLCQGHANAISILSEANREPVARSVYGVWAGRSTERLMRAECTSDGWILHGELPNCSGVNCVDRALIVARLPEPMLFDVDRSALGNVEVETYRAVGMAGADNCSVHLERCQLPIDALVGSPGFYTSRRGSSASCIDVAACWLGGAVGIYRAGLNQLSQPILFDAHAQAHLGAAFASLSAAGQVLHDAAHAIDAGEATAALHRRALWTRHIVEQSCFSVLDHMSRALGDSPVRFDASHARRIADLPVYLRQGQTERDLASLGELVGKISDATWL